MLVEDVGVGVGPTTTGRNIPSTIFTIVPKCILNNLHTGRALCSSSPFMNCTFTAMLRAEPCLLVKLSKRGYTYNRFLKHNGDRFYFRTI